MQKTIIFISSLLFTISLSAQAPGWSWASSANGTAEVEPRAATTDTLNNLYVAGRYDAGYAVFGNDTLFNSGASDIFLTKYDAAGNVTWTLRAGGSAGDRANAVVTDVAGNIYLAGFFESSKVIFGNDTLTNANPPWADVFLVKFDSNGNVLWARRDGDTNNYDEADVITIDPSGDIYVAGTYSGITSIYGTDTLINQGPSYTDIFLAKYTANGNLTWVKNAGSNSWDYPESITASASGDIYLSGNYEGNVFIGGPYNLNNQQTGSGDLFLAKYNANGNVVWLKGAKGDAIDQGTSITTDASGNIYMSAFYNSDSITFGSFTLYNSSAAWSLYNDDMVLVKYDTSGNVKWVRTASGNDDEQTKSIAADASGNIYVAGFFKGDSMNVGAAALYPLGGISGGYDIFMIKYDTSGTEEWAIRAGGPGNDQAPHIASRGNLLWSTGGKMSSSASGSMYVTGFFDSPSINFGSDVVTSSGNQNMFAAKLGSVTTGIKSNENISLINVYPNPTNGKFSIDLGNTKTKTADIVIYNSMGKKVAERSADKNSKPLNFDLSGYNDGVYFVKINSGEKTFTKKVIVNNE